MLHLPFGAAAYDLPFELELHDGGGLLHARHQKVVAQARPLRLEALRRVVAVNVAREFFERRDDDAVALFELREPPIAQRDSQHRSNERGVAEARAYPRRVVVAPGEGDVRLL